MAEVEDISKYYDAWTRTQLDIWREKIERMRIVSTGALHESFASHIAQSEMSATITMRFAQYGIYQALGTGRGYTPGNLGNLEFLDKDYRQAHGLDKPRKVGPAWGGYKTSGKPRKARDWYSKKLYMSVMAMAEDLARIGAENAAHVVCEQLSDVRSALHK